MLCYFRFFLFLIAVFFTPFFGIAWDYVNPSGQVKMALISSIVNFIIQIPFCLIQRYNRPRLFTIKLALKADLV
ncbi:glycosyl-4,4'-diaponeurosporenoate acyltransferase CrtO family protein [Halobacillus sp. B23F22_1]|uniref:glycosyl-4,4'-diaponeurosporenoate acyltransferase CrtO family protein n=1 Tax=Halobacillus sp. B23F22_1 TaxID=3459514 RepID=UPI00373E3AAD